MVSVKDQSKQRKRRANALMHKKQKLMSVHLSKSLRDKYSKRSMPARVGDSVVVLRGSNKGKKGKVESVDLSKMKIGVEGVKIKRADGKEILVRFEPSNLQLTDLNIDDNKRFKRIKDKLKVTEKSK